MKLRFLGLGISALALLIAKPSSSAQLNQDVKILKVIDGDTIYIQHGEEEKLVDLACIDAPELVQETYGLKSAKTLTSLLAGKPQTHLQMVPSGSGSKEVAFIFNQNKFVNQEMIRTGNAVMPLQLDAICLGYTEQLKSSQIVARDYRLSYWQQSNPVMPWDIRSRYPQNLSTVTSLHQIHTKLQEAEERKDWKTAITLIEQIIIRDPQQSLQFASQKQEIIAKSRKESFLNSGKTVGTQKGTGSKVYSGNCRYSWQTDSSGRRCGGRSANSRPGGYNSYRRSSYSRSSSSSRSQRSNIRSYGSGKTYVKGYTRKNGTRVKGYYRSKPRK